MSSKPPPPDRRFRCGRCGLEAPGARAPAVAAGKALKARLALGVDLAAIELLALVSRR